MRALQARARTNGCLRIRTPSTKSGDPFGSGVDLEHRGLRDLADGRLGVLLHVQSPPHRVCSPIRCQGVCATCSRSVTKEEHWPQGMVQGFGPQRTRPADGGPLHVNPASVQAVDRGASCKNWAAASRMSDFCPNAHMVHLPMLLAQPGEDLLLVILFVLPWCDRSCYWLDGWSRRWTSGLSHGPCAQPGRVGDGGRCSGVGFRRPRDRSACGFGVVTPVEPGAAGRAACSNNRPLTGDAHAQPHDTSSEGHRREGSDQGPWSHPAVAADQVRRER